MDIQIGGHVLRVLYNPNLSTAAVLDIASSVTPSMWSDDSAQYCLATIVDLITSGILDVSATDSAVLSACVAEGYHYIEVQSLP